MGNEDASNAPPSPPTPEPPGPPEPRAKRPTLSLVQVMATVLAAASSTAAMSRLGAAGTVYGAALAAAITVIGNYLYTRWLVRTHETALALAKKASAALPGIVPFAGASPHTDDDGTPTQVANQSANGADGIGGGQSGEGGRDIAAGQDGEGGTTTQVADASTPEGSGIGGEGRDGEDGDGEDGDGGDGIGG
ncbi:MAG: hypothetical protein LBJ08_11465, partial [Bifidobacteriaceae bacterium]|nr:hypothetical protein [Bifidobacteriaceae bacterium]